MTSLSTQQLDKHPVLIPWSAYRATQFAHLPWDKIMETLGTEFRRPNWRTSVIESAP